MADGPGTDGIARFIEDRLAEDEAAARRAAYGGAVWTQVDPVRYPGHIDAEHGIVVYDEGSPDENQAPHIARHDPSRALREVTALRAILAEHGSEHMCFENTRDGNTWDWYDGDCRIVLHLASVYADHPAYDPSWAPAGVAS